jgi:DegV family protein with EDD domain
VVTDSTAYLPEELVSRHGLRVVPLAVAINGISGREGVEVTTDQVARALEARRFAVTTSRPAPADFTQAYRSALEAGVTGVVSVHLSAKLSGTYESACLAAADFDGQVEVIDSRSTGMGLGFAVLAAATASNEGGDLAAVSRAASEALSRTSTLFYVDTLEFLRRGGRIGAASALLGTALSVKPILHMVGGEIVVRDRVRTASRALARLVDLAVEAAGDAPVDIAVHHLAAASRAAHLRGQLTERLGAQVRESYETQIGAVVGAHVGPGLVAVVVNRCGPA